MAKWLVTGNGVDFGVHKGDTEEDAFTATAAAFRKTPEELRAYGRLHFGPCFELSATQLPDAQEPAHYLAVVRDIEHEARALSVEGGPGEHAALFVRARGETRCDCVVRSTPEHKRMRPRLSLSPRSSLPRFAMVNTLTPEVVLNLRAETLLGVTGEQWLAMGHDQRAAVVAAASLRYECARLDLPRPVWVWLDGYGHREVTTPEQLAAACSAAAFNRQSAELYYCDFGDDYAPTGRKILENGEVVG